MRCDGLPLTAALDERVREAESRAAALISDHTGYWFPFGSRTGVHCTDAIRHLSARRTNTAVVPMDVVHLGVSFVNVIRPVSIAVSP